MRIVLLIAITLLAGGCRAVEMRPSDVPIRYQPARYERPVVHEFTYAARDGRQLGCASYLAATTEIPREAVVYVHGIESHAGWFDAPARLLQEQGLDVYCLDRRGSGINRENRGFVSGHIDAIETLIADTVDVIGYLKLHYDQVWLVGLSWGGKLATACALLDPEDIAGVILVTPGLKALVDVSLPTKLLVLVWSVTNPQGQVATPIEPEMFTTTPRYLDFIENDPLRLRTVSARFLTEGVRLDGFIADEMESNEVPMLLVLAGQDRIIDNEATTALVRRSAAAVEVVTYDDQTHSVQFDAPRRLVGDMTRWFAARRALSGTSAAAR